MEAKPRISLSVQDYQTLEKDTQTKYEYHNGQVFAMVGGSYNHGLLCGNIYPELRNGLRKNGANYKPLSSEIKLHIASRNNYVHPDAMVVCGKVEKASTDANAVLNPTVIVEVLSESTAEYDRGDKFYLYRQIPGFKEYIIINQNKSVVEIFFKPPDSDLWKITRYESLEDEIKVESLGIKIQLADLYFDIDFSQ